MTRVADLIRGMGSVLVCYSGGVDSAFVLAVAHKVLGEKCIGMTAVSPSLAPSRLEGRGLRSRVGSARGTSSSSLTRDRGRVVREERRRPLLSLQERALPHRREEAARVGTAHVVNGTNLDDLGDYRPGPRRREEAGARSPLVEAGLTQGRRARASRAWASASGTSPRRPACRAASLTARRVTRERLAQIGALEGAPRARHSPGARPLARLAGPSRDAAGGIARMEIGRGRDAARLRARDGIVAAGKRSASRT